MAAAGAGWRAAAAGAGRGGLRAGHSALQALTGPWTSWTSRRSAGAPAAAVGRAAAYATQGTPTPTFRPPAVLPLRHPPTSAAAGAGAGGGAPWTFVRWAGHNKWSKIFRDKAVNDQKRSQAFTKVAKEIVAAVKELLPSVVADGAAHGADPATNSALAAALLRAKDCSMPKSNVENAIQRGLGKTEGDLERIVYEATFPRGGALVIETLTDKRTRTVTLLRTLLHKHGCELGTSGSVMWMFKHQGVVTISGSEPLNTDIATEAALEAGAADVALLDDGRAELLCEPNELQRVRQAVEQRGFKVDALESVYVPQNMIGPLRASGITNIKETPPDSLEMFQSLVSQLEDLDDVIRVSHNVVEA